MPTVPSAANAIALFPSLFAWSDSDYVPDNLVTWDQALLRQWSKLSLRNSVITKADTTCLDLD
jgi:hypothetical protein